MEIGTVGIVGAGTMGGGIATSLVGHGFRVVLHDSNAAAVEAATARAAAFFARGVDKGRMTAEAAQASLGRMRAARRLDELGPADLVIEAVFEDFALKAEVLARVASMLDAKALLATNTSCLRVRDLAAHVPAPGRFLGLHYFSPAEINPVVEVVQGPATEPAAIEAALRFTRAHAKAPLRCADSHGFAVNRFFCPYTNEAARLIDEEVAAPGDIDAVAGEVLGAAAGPFAVMNLVKTRINLHAIRNLAPLGRFYAPAGSMIATGEADAAWTITAPTSLEPGRRRTVADRLLGACFLPILQALDEEVAAPAAFDAGATGALRFKNPPCALMDRLGRDEVGRILAPLLAAHAVERPAALARVGRLTA